MEMAAEEVRSVTLERNGLRHAEMIHDVNAITAVAPDIGIAVDAVAGDGVLRNGRPKHERPDEDRADRVRPGRAINREP